MKPMKQCGHAGCNKLIAFDERYCDKHKQDGKRKPHTSTTSDYANEIHQSWKWRKVSRLYRLHNPICEQCLKENATIPRLASSVDHIKPLFLGGKPFDEDNLQSLCDFHHSIKSQEERQKNKP